MLKTNSKVYYVYEYGGEYEDRWEHSIGVCSSLELAQELKALNESSRMTENSIYDEYESMLHDLWEYKLEKEEVCENEIEDLLKLFPNYTREELEKAEEIYWNYSDYIGTMIREINFYN